MKILIINIDSKTTNLALAKIEVYHKQRKDKIIWDFPLLLNEVDKIYVSAILDWNKKKAQEYEVYGAEIGGSGYDIKKTLPPEIESIKPHLNFGFTTRGCIRNCGFCIVQEKEGPIRIVGDIYDLWDKKSKKIILYDNNILAAPDHFFKICKQLRKEKLKIDFNQGLDVRLIDDSIAKEIKKLKHITQVRISWDTMEMEKAFHKGIKHLLKYFKPSRIMVYVLIAYNTSFYEDLYRVLAIKRYGCDPFIMVYNNAGTILQREFGHWLNRFYFRNLSFEKFLTTRNNLDLLKEEENCDKRINTLLQQFERSSFRQNSNKKNP